MEYSEVFKHFYQNIRAYPRSTKKPGLINSWDNIFTYWKESKQSKALANKLGLLQIQLWDLGGGATSGKFFQFFPSLKLTQNFP